MLSSGLICNVNRANMSIKGVWNNISGFSLLYNSLECRSFSIENFLLQRGDVKQANDISFVQFVLAVQSRISAMLIQWKYPQSKESSLIKSSFCLYNLSDIWWSLKVKKSLLVPICSGCWKLYHHIKPFSLSKLLIPGVKNEQITRKVHNKDFSPSSFKPKHIVSESNLYQIFSENNFIFNISLCSL